MKTRLLGAGTLVALALAATAAYAGGFGIDVQAPNPKDARMKDAVVVFQAYGCHGPGAKVTATAEGIVDGKRKSIPLRMKNLGGDAFMLTRQWPKEGRWVLAVTATSPPWVHAGKSHTAKDYVAVPISESGGILVSNPKGEKPVITARRAHSEPLMKVVDKMLKEPEARRAAL